MTADERQSIENGVWLCQVCAKLVDNDEASFTVAVLLDWKETAEYLANREVGTGSRTRLVALREALPEIRFTADDWQMWRAQGNLPGDAVVIIGVWARGDVRYACTVRLRNESDDEIQLKRLRIEFQSTDAAIIHSDHFAIQPDEVVLPSRKWISIAVDYGLHDEAVFHRASRVSLSALIVGDNQPLRWTIADYDPRLIPPPES